jgi:hypothetical protein
LVSNIIIQALRASVFVVRTARRALSMLYVYIGAFLGLSG